VHSNVVVGLKIALRVISDSVRDDAQGNFCEVLGFHDLYGLHILTVHTLWDTNAVHLFSLLAGNGNMTDNIEDECFVIFSFMNQIM